MRSTIGKGYGRLKIDGKDQLAHRVAYELFKDPIPEEKLVMHSCDVRPCCNPKHLFLGTHQDNMDDKVNKQRQARGSQNGNARLTEVGVKSIRQDDRSFKVIGDAHGIAADTVGQIKRRRRWNHIPD